MTTLQVAGTSIVMMLILIGLRVPIGVAMGGVAFLGLWYLRNFNVALSVLRDTPFVFAANWDLSAIPMFLLMGAIASNSGIGAALFRAAYAWFGSLPGGIGGRDQLGLCGLRRRIRFEHRRRRGDGASRRAGNAQEQIRQGARDRRLRLRRHARCADPALDPVRDLWRVRGSLDRQAAAGRHPAGSADRRRLHDHDRGALLAESRARASGQIRQQRREMEGALGLAAGNLADPCADRRCDGRSLLGRGVADRIRRGRRADRDRDRRCAAQAVVARLRRQLQGRDRHHGAIVLRRHRRGDLYQVPRAVRQRRRCSPNWSEAGRSIRCCW